MDYQTIVIIFSIEYYYFVGTFKGIFMYITLEINMMSHILTTMLFQ